MAWWSGIVLVVLMTPDAGVPPSHAALELGREAPVDMTVNGALEKAVIHQAIAHQAGELEACARRAQATNAKLEGRVVVKFVIGPKGGVSASYVLSSTLSASRTYVEASTGPAAELESCLATVVGTARFPSSDNGGVVIVTYPFVVSRAAR